MNISSQIGQRLHRSLARALSALENLKLILLGVQINGHINMIGFPIVFGCKSSLIRFERNSALVSVSKGTSLGVSRRSIIRTLSRGDVIEIGDHTGLSGETICSVNRVSIGERCLIGSDVTIIDTDFHPLEVLNCPYAGIPNRDKNHEISIGNDVFIGARSIILKGVQIGSGSVIGAGSVVTGDIPPRSIFAGNPAVFVRRL